MSDEPLTLEQLSELTGVETRTLRSWVSEGLLAPPFTHGRGARYPSTNVDRALAVQALKNSHRLSLSEIGRRFMMVTESQIRQWAIEAGQTTASGGTAREYIRRISKPSEIEGDPDQSMDLFTTKPRSGGHERRSYGPYFSKPSGKSAQQGRSDARKPDLASIERLILQLEEVLEGPAQRRSRGTVWTRISVTPDLEISVRGDLEPGERFLFEQLADHFRAILTGRTKND